MHGIIIGNRLSSLRCANVTLITSRLWHSKDTDRPNEVNTLLKQNEKFVYARLKHLSEKFEVKMLIISVKWAAMCLIMNTHRIWGTCNL
jgi:hypothetical protein